MAAIPLIEELSGSASGQMIADLAGVGGDFADYFDPADFGQAYDLIERAIFEPGFVKSREERLRAGFKPEKWADTFRSIVAILDTELARKD